VKKDKKDTFCKGDMVRSHSGAFKGVGTVVDQYPPKELWERYGNTAPAKHYTVLCGDGAVRILEEDYFELLGRQKED
jgi:hypothetical protein